MSTQRKTRNTSNGRGTRGSSGRTIHYGSSATGTTRTEKTVIPGLGGPNGQGFGNAPTGQTNYSTTGQFQGDWQQMLNLPVSNLRFNYIDFLVQLLGQKNIPQELQTLIMQQLLQQGVNAEQRSYDWQLTQDQRQYDWNLLQDSRIYNSPTNELARLMGAGISRDAAIQLLSGATGGSGVGVGSGSPVVGGSSQVPLSDTFGNQSLATAQTAISGIQTIMNLMSQGIDVTTAISNAQMMQAQNVMTQSQLQAFTGVNDVASAFNRAVLDGTLSVEDLQNLRTADDYYKWITDHAESKMIKPLIDNGSVAAVFGSTIGRDMMNRHLENTRLGRDAGSILDEYIRGQKLQNAAAALQPDKIAAEMLLIGSQAALSDQQIIESCNKIAIGEAQIEVLNEQGKFIRVQSNKAESEIDYLRAQIEGQQINNKQLNLNYEYNEAGFPMLKQNRIDELTVQAMKWSTLLRDPNYSKGALKQLQKSWLLEYANAADAAYVMNLYYNAVGDFATNHPGLYQLGACFKETGLAEMLKFSVGAATAATPLIR